MNYGDWIVEPSASLIENEQELIGETNKGGLWSETSHEKLNFLWQENNVYVMDNHLVAGWCWLHECSSSKNYNFLHIDQHTDDGCCLPEERIKKYFPMLSEEIELDEYCNLTYEKYGQIIPLFQCERYIRPISIFHPSWFYKCIFATHQSRNLDIIKKMADENQLVDYLNSPTHIESHEVVSSILKIKDVDKKWIVNIDLDYLYKDDEQVLDNNYFCEISSAISKVRENIEVITIALSTPWCNGLQNSLEILSHLAKDIPELQHFSLAKYL